MSLSSVITLPDGKQVRIFKQNAKSGLSKAAGFYYDANTNKYYSNKYHTSPTS